MSEAGTVPLLAHRAKTERNEEITRAIAAGTMRPGRYEALVARLNSARSLHEMNDVAHRFGLRMVGEGSGRRVYVLNVAGYEPTALKLNWNREEGEPQSTAELHCARQSESPLAPEVYRWGSKGDAVTWLEMELLWDIDAEGFERATHHRFPIFYSESATGDVAQEFEAALDTLTRDCKPYIWDLVAPHQWGVGSSGLLRVADLGTVDLDVLDAARREVASENTGPATNPAGVASPLRRVATKGEPAPNTKGREAKRNPLAEPYRSRFSSHEVHRLESLECSARSALAQADRARREGRHRDADEWEAYGEAHLETLEHELQALVEDDTDPDREPEGWVFLPEPGGYLAAQYAEFISGRSPHFRTEAELAWHLRAYLAGVGSLRSDVTDQQVLAAARDAYEARSAQRTRASKRNPGQITVGPIG